MDKNNAQNVTTGKPKIGGAIFRAAPSFLPGAPAHASGTRIVCRKMLEYLQCPCYNEKH